MSEVWKDGDWVYKRQHEFLTDNEIYFYEAMYHTCYVPYAEQVDKDLICIEFIPLERVTSITSFLAHLEPVLRALSSANIKHGDLTEYAVRVKDNKPYLIDFSESRFIDDPRQDKRPETDRYWLTKVMHKLAHVTNLRLAAQWGIVSKHVDFADKDVLDIGCGHADMLRAVSEAHASNIVGIDSNEDVLKNAVDAHLNGNIKLMQGDMNRALPPTKVDVIICFSVLPYLKDQDKVLDWLSKSSEISLIEVQYANDGPGIIKDDVEAKNIFSNYWDNVTPLGKTLVDYRKLYRTIWLCENRRRKT